MLFLRETEESLHNESVAQVPFANQRHVEEDALLYFFSVFPFKRIVTTRDNNGEGSENKNTCLDYPVLYVYFLALDSCQFFGQTEIAKVCLRYDCS